MKHEVIGLKDPIVGLSKAGVKARAKTAPVGGALSTELFLPDPVALPSGAALRRAAFQRYQAGVKRGLDLLGCVLLIPVVGLLIAGLWALVRLDGGPGFYGHTRVGRGGVPFRCWKLRTMCRESEARLEQHLATDAQAAAEWAASYKLQNDPRVTRLGRVLRKTSLDELPQIWNVLKGEMSLVGPRPVPAVELVEYAGYEWAYLAARPGITGLWQVSGRNEVSYSTRVGLDLRYVLEAGVRLDAKILWRTIGVVLGRTGV